MPIIDITSAIANEGAPLVFNVTLSEPSLADVTVKYRLVADGSAELVSSSDINPALRATPLR